MRDLNDKNSGNDLTADEWNDVPSEVQEVIENTGQTLSGADLKQLAKGIAQYVANGDFYTDSGVADAYILTPLASKQTPVAYTDGMRVRTRVLNTNTGASTANVATLGVKNIFKNGSATIAGDIPVGTSISMEYDLANDRLNLGVVESAIASFPSGTLMLFQQTAAPTGWTKGVTHDDKSLRVVTGAAGSGGATAFTTVFGAGKTSASHALTIGEIPAHTHPVNLGTGSAGSVAFSGELDSGSNVNSDSTGGDGGHTHDLSLDLQFVDLIIASKD